MVKELSELGLASSETTSLDSLSMFYAFRVRATVLKILIIVAYKCMRRGKVIGRVVAIIVVNKNIAKSGDLGT